MTPPENSSDGKILPENRKQKSWNVLKKLSVSLYSCSDH